MDIEFLLVLQRAREGAGAFLTAFLSKMTWWGELTSVMMLMAIIYWCVDKSFGSYLLMGWSGNRILNGAMKLTACVYRPWIRDARILPDATAKLTATGYSFPSGHTMNAASAFGGSALRSELRKPLRALLWLILILVAFSRMFLGVHTPQDVVVGGVIGVLFMLLAKRLMAWVDAHPEKDVLIAAIGVVIAIAVTIYAFVRRYPADTDADGKLLVDGTKMAIDTFKGTGYASAFLIGWVLERRFVRFTTDVTMEARAFRATAGLMGYYVVNLILGPLLKNALSPSLGNLASCFLLMFYVVFLFPWIIVRCSRLSVAEA